MDGWESIAAWKGLILVIALGLGVWQLISVRRDMRRAGDHLRRRDGR